MRIVIGTGKGLSPDGPKLALGVLRYRPDDVVAVIDAMHAGKTTADVTGDGTTEPKPVVADLAAALSYRPDTFLVGPSLRRQAITPRFRAQVMAAIGTGLNVISGLHYILGDDAAISEAARGRGVRIWDLRRAGDDGDVAQYRPHRAGSWTTVAVGSDCSTGKMTTMLEVEREARERGLSSEFVATGQTGILIAGRGVPADHIISDFLPGAIEAAVLDAASRHDWVFVEGQGALNHPAYSPVTLGIIHGASPDSMILCHRSSSDTLLHEPQCRIPALRELVAINEQAANWLGRAVPSEVVAIALNTSQLPAPMAHAELARVAEETGLPTADPVRFGAGPLLDAVIEARISSS